MRRISINIGGYARAEIKGVVDYVQAAEKLGVDCVWSAEAWGQDAITSLAYLAGKTKTIHLGTGIMQISARAPSMTAMTALSLYHLSDGRFRLGLGVSGPQVVEGLHGSSFKAPLTRLRETLEICRLAFAGEKLVYDGSHIKLPLPNGEGKALRIDQPAAEIPIYLATLGPKALEYTGQAADGWLGTSFSPDYPEAHLPFIEAGAKASGRKLSELDLNVAVPIAISDDVEGLIESRKTNIAFTLGAMGSAQTNFYNAAIRRAGFEDDAKAVQSLWIDGKRKEAAMRVPTKLVTAYQVLGTREMVARRLQQYRTVGVNSLGLVVDTKGTLNERLERLENIVDVVRSLE